MSHALMRAVRGVQLPPTTKLVLMILCDRADETGTCWPSVERLASETGVLPRAVQRNLRKLEAAGFISRKYTGRTTRYTVILSTLKASAETSGDTSEVSLETPLTCPESHPKQFLSVSEAPVNTCETQEKEPMALAEDMQKKLQAKVDSLLAKPSGSFTQEYLSMCYRAWLSHFLGVKLANLSPKDRNVLKTALKNYPGLPRALWFAIARWPEFSAKVASDRGLKVLPNYPHPIWVAAYLNDFAAFDEACEEAGVNSGSQAASQKIEWL